MTINQTEISDTDDVLQDALCIVEAGPEHPEYDMAWEYLALCQNPSIRKAMRVAMEQTFGPYPAPTGYTDEGEPHWSLAVMSKYLDIPEDELTAQSMEIQERWGEEAGIVRTEDLNKVH
ncbi:MAG: hypothetical protein HQL70_04885 [Magnetococcales bacterium]|nr:hypothetical protein [Magnetococcales bacterium]